MACLTLYYLLQSRLQVTSPDGNCLSTVFKYEWTLVAHCESPLPHHSNVVSP
jgi:hypothetical protein